MDFVHFANSLSSYAGAGFKVEDYGSRHSGAHWTPQAGVMGALAEVEVGQRDLVAVRT